eukprot:3934868-Rhodomonas_salina.1
MEAICVAYEGGRAKEERQEGESGSFWRCSLHARCLIILPSLHSITQLQHPSSSSPIPECARVRARALHAP